LGLGLWFLAWFRIPRGAIATDEAGDTFWVDVLPVYPEGRLFALGCALLLLAKHEMDLFGLDILSDMPCGESIFVLFFSDSPGVRRYL
jgi:hypothetical protein